MRKYKLTSKQKTRFWQKVKKTKSCWLWKSSIKNGYGVFWLNGKYEYAHRISYYLKHGKFPKDKPHCCHKPKICHNPLCVNPHHLYAGSQPDNVKDKSIDETVLKGEQIHQAVLTKDDVLKIRMLYKKRYKQQELADMFNISRSHVSGIVNYKKWKHV